MFLQGILKCLLVNAAFRIQWHNFHHAQALSPRQFVGVMFIGPDEDHRAILLRNLLCQLIALAQLRR